jgi:hypothetical protein
MEASRQRETYMVVVSRPYLLAFYAHEPKRVAWVVAAAYVSSCEKNKPQVMLNCAHLTRRLAMKYQDELANHSSFHAEQ